MFDGIVRTITDVMHVPGMKRNLLSCSNFDRKGYKYYGGDGVLKVSKSSLIVMKGDLRGPKLYHLQGITIIGNVAVSSHSSSDSDSDATNFWHKRLGHMSKQKLAVLSKRGLLDG